MPRTQRPFWSLVKKSKKCWEWIGYKAESGHGIARNDGKPIKAHRLAWILLRGPIPSGIFVCHHCDNPACVRPTHLFLGTAKDNNRDRHFKGRSRGLFTAGADHPAKIRAGDGHWCTKLSNKNVKEIRRLHSTGWSQKALGTAFDVNPATISRIIRNLWRIHA